MANGVDDRFQLTGHSTLLHRYPRCGMLLHNQVASSREAAASAAVSSLGSLCRHSRSAAAG